MLACVCVTELLGSAKLNGVGADDATQRTQAWLRGFDKVKETMMSLGIDSGHPLFKSPMASLPTYSISTSGKKHQNAEAVLRSVLASHPPPRTRTTATSVLGISGVGASGTAAGAGGASAASEQASAARVDEREATGVVVVQVDSSSGGSSDEESVPLADDATAIEDASFAAAVRVMADQLLAQAATDAEVAAGGDSTGSGNSGGEVMVGDNMRVKNALSGIGLTVDGNTGLLHDDGKEMELEFAGAPRVLPVQHLSSRGAHASAGDKLKPGEEPRRGYVIPPDTAGNGRLVQIDKRAMCAAIVHTRAGATKLSSDRCLRIQSAARRKRVFLPPLLSGLLCLSLFLCGPLSRTLLVSQLHLHCLLSLTLAQRLSLQCLCVDVRASCGTALRGCKA